MEAMKKNFSRCLAPICFLIELYRGNQLSGYDVVKLLRSYDLKISHGTVYSQLHNMKRDGLVESTRKNNVEVYSLTVDGRKIFQTFIEDRLLPLRYIASVLDEIAS
jgi:DNA-binding PadR family transcriptional regulator